VSSIVLRVVERDEMVAHIHVTLSRRIGRLVDRELEWILLRRGRFDRSRVTMGLGMGSCFSAGLLSDERQWTGEAVDFMLLRLHNLIARASTGVLKRMRGLGRDETRLGSRKIRTSETAGYRICMLRRGSNDG
jgi:hypothetical protein